MQKRNLLLGLAACVALLSSAAAQERTAPAAADYAVEYQPGCETGCVYPAAEKLGFFARMKQTWAERSRRKRRERLARAQANKGLLHAEAPPLFHPSWGYHETCWRQFPPLCNECPPAFPVEPIVPSLAPDEPPLPSANPTEFFEPIKYSAPVQYSDPVRYSEPIEFLEPIRFSDPLEISDPFDASPAADSSAWTTFEDGPPSN